MQKVVGMNMPMTVSRWEKYDIMKDEWVPSKRWATPEFILAAGGRPYGDAILADVTEFDGGMSPIGWMPKT